MRRALDETGRRRAKQLAFNADHGIEPRTVEKSVEQVLAQTSVADAIGTSEAEDLRALLSAVDAEGPDALIATLEAEMLDAARQLEFERAASLRDRIDEVRAAVEMAAKMGLPGTAGRAMQGAGEALESSALARRSRTPREPRRRSHRHGRDR
jgi:excinuclease ABC subunit B